MTDACYGDPVTEIVAAARESGAGLIAIAGGIAPRILPRMPTPVFLEAFSQKVGCDRCSRAWRCASS
jgi:glucokinase